MSSAIVIGSGIAGMTCAVKLAEAGINVELVSPFPSEQSQSVMAAGGINAVLTDGGGIGEATSATADGRAAGGATSAMADEAADSVASHVEDTLRSGCGLSGNESVARLCADAENIIRDLERIGTIFTLDELGRPARRAFGGQSHRRTRFSGSATGKQIVSALVMETRRFEAAGLIRRRLWSCFYAGLIRDGICHGVLIFDEGTQRIEASYADAVVIATGGMNALFGKTTGSTQCDGYAAGKLFLQGAELKNLEFIQYHPTTIETAQKRMLISEAVRGEGGRLFYLEDGKRVYFMEDQYGPRGNLMTRDVISREIARTGREVFLDISFLDAETIDRRLPEVRDLCLKYRGIDIKKEPIPVGPSVHFFMGGFAVDNQHETNIRNLFAIGECASMYHGANRLGGNSLLAAIHGGRIAAAEIARRVSEEAPAEKPEFSDEIAAANAALRRQASAESPFPPMYLREMLAETMQKDLGIVRDEASLAQGIADIDYYLSVADKIAFDGSVMIHEIYSMHGILALARAVLVCAKARKESRGAHYRADHPEQSDAFDASTIISYEDGAYRVRLDTEHAYES